jgi:hypothetical protein
VFIYKAGNHVSGSACSVHFTLTFTYWPFTWSIESTRFCRAGKSRKASSVIQDRADSRAGYKNTHDKATNK